MKTYIDSDHHGNDLKHGIIASIASQFDIFDLAYGVEHPYPIIAKNLACYIQLESDARGILICKTGIGMAITANKFQGIYANNCSSLNECLHFREDNNGNVLCLGAENIKISEAIEICVSFLSTKFDRNHQNRITLLQSIEEGVYKWKL